MTTSDQRTHRLKIQHPDAPEPSSYSRPPCPSPNTACSACRRLDDVLAKINQTNTKDDLLIDLLRKREEAGASVNQAHPSIIDRMPTEVASLVFECYVQECSPLKLGTVCRTWRRLAWSNPRLWTSFEMNIGRLVTLSGAQLEVAREWFARSGSLALSITLLDDAVWYKSTNHYTFITPIIELINQYSPKWRSLHLHLPASVLQAFNDSAGSPRGLHTLSLGVPFQHSGDLDALKISISQQGMPEVVWLEGIPLRSLTIQWTRVTTVYTYGLVLADIKQILRLAPALQEGTFILNHPEDRSASSSFTDTDLLVHPQLKTLEFRFENDEDDELMDIISFFDTISTPSLLCLRCTFSPGIVVPETTLAAFLRRSSCPLEELALEQGCLSSEGLIEIMRSVPLLTSLQLATPMAPPPMHLFFDAFAKHLASDSSVNWTSHATPHDSEPLLPHLKRFYWRGGSHFPWENFLALFAPPPPSSPREADDAPSRLRPLERLEIFGFARSDEPIPYIEKKVLDDLVDSLHGLNYNFCLCYPGGGGDWVGMSFDKLKAQDDAKSGLAATSL